MKKLLWTIHWKLSAMIGYTIYLRDWYDPKTFTLVKKNTHMAILKIIGKEDVNGHRRVKEIFQIQIRKIKDYHLSMGEEINEVELNDIIKKKK